MARKNTLRVSDKLDYEEHIKGKRLIRLSAGVCSGKNYAFEKIAFQYPNLRMLIITSRKNTVIAQANKLKANSFIDLDECNDMQPNSGKCNVVCTNACIERYFKNQYNPKDKRTHLWDKFDLIVLDEAHALTTDATFTDCFYTERFLKHTYYKNPNCDIVFMSGTLSPVNWLLNEKNTPPIHDLDWFEDCVHLEPDNVYLMHNSAVKHYIYNSWEKNERIVYFANYISNIAEIVSWLMSKGVPHEDFGFSFNLKKEENDEKGTSKFPEIIANSLESRIEQVNTMLTTEERISSNIKILFSTSKNKEGINILDDDIKTIVAESHVKSELIQIAGRVRGNSDNGSGIDTLIIVSDARQHIQLRDDINYLLCRNVAYAMNKTRKQYIQKYGKELSPQVLLEKIQTKAFDYIRYDYISEEFVLYEGRYEGQGQYMNDIREFESIVNQSVVKKDDNGNWLHFSGNEVLQNEWFKYSRIFDFHKNEASIKEMATMQLKKFLNSNNYIDIKITTQDREKIKTEVCRLATIYGYKNLNIKENFSSLGSVLKRFGFEIKQVSNNSGNVKYIIHEIG